MKLEKKLKMQEKLGNIKKKLTIVGLVASAAGSVVGLMMQINEIQIKELQKEENREGP